MKFRRGAKPRNPFLARGRGDQPETGAELLQQRGDILSQCPESICIEAIRFPLRRTQKISDRSPTQSIEESKNPALLHDER